MRVKLIIILLLMCIMNNSQLLNAINNSQIDIIKKLLPKILVSDTTQEYIKNIIIATLKNTKSDTTILCYVIEQLNLNLNRDVLIHILSTTVINRESDKLSLLDYVFQNKLFFDECDLITLLWKNKVTFLAIDNNYLSYIYNNYSKIKDEKEVQYHIIKNCKIIELLSGTEVVINNLIYMFKVIGKDDYYKYKMIYMSFEEYDAFYKINKNNEHIKYFMINVLFLSMLEKINYKSLHKLLKTIIYNRELLSYLRQVLREDPEKTQKYKNINEIATESIFVNSEHQVLLTKMIGLIFDFNNSTTSLMK